MTVGEYLKQATAKLKESGIATARLDSLILLEHILKTDRAALLAKPELKLTQTNINLLNDLIDKRSIHVPIAQLLQKTEFYGRVFTLNSSVLEPRPESETMIDSLKSIVASEPYLAQKHALENGPKVTQNKTHKLVVADVGTGSGAIGITAKLELPNIDIELIDIDQEALKMAQINVDLHTIDARLILSDLLSSTTSNYDILLCNLPYVPDNFQINLAATHEPKIAIFGGKDGLDIYRRLFKNISNIQHRPLYILSEAMPPSHQKLSEIAKNTGYNLMATNDFIQTYKLTA